MHFKYLIQNNRDSTKNGCCHFKLLSAVPLMKTSQNKISKTIV